MNSSSIKRDSQLLLDIKAEERGEGKSGRAGCVVEDRETIDLVRDKMKVVLLGESTVLEESLTRV